MKVYKLQHKPTGLFYKPSTGSGNFSKNGKIYTAKPSLKWATTLRIVMRNWYKKPSKVEQILIDYFKLEFDKNGCIDKHVTTFESDWQIIEL